MEEEDMTCPILKGELKPCPFCGCIIEGEQPYVDDFDTDDDYWVIKCGYCNAMIYDNLDRNEVIRKWNQRARI